MSAIDELYKVILSRKECFEEESYTCYLFTKGLDKILKKVGEESAETIIAAKNGSHDEIVGETSDLIYHLAVMLAERGVPWEDVEAELERRSQKLGNLKKMRTTDKET